MTRQAIRGLVLMGLVTVLVVSTARAQNTPDVVTVRDRKDGSTKTISGLFTATAAGFQVVGGDKKVIATVNPDDVVKVAIGELQGVDRNVILSAVAKEEKKDYEGARAGYADALKKAAGAPERTKQYLTFKANMCSNKVADELDVEKGWKEKSEAVVKAWSEFLRDQKSGWELWPAARACSRVQTELGNFEGAAQTWNRIVGNKDLPPDARLEASLQAVDLDIRGKRYSNVSVTAAELLKTATGSRKDRLVIYEIAAKGGSEKPLDAVPKIKAEMDKSKDASVHATGYSMLGEMYLAGGKPREAMWAFLWVETVLNQDRDEAFRAVTRLTQLFEKDLNDEDQAKKYREKLKRVRASL